ncbi:MAG: 50S ribosomal protein L29 [Bacillales bacterium]|nr:50S ribosomal protein L29 [Bacillales bacterium]
MRIEEIRKLSDEQITKEIKDLKKALFDLRFKQATGQLENTAEIGKTRKTIARLSTVLTERGAK